jgi:hypothetical protein
MRTFHCLAALLLASTASAQTFVFQEDFEKGFSSWSMTGYWNAQSADEPCSAAAVPFPSGTACAWFGNGNTCNFENGGWDNRYLTYLAPIQLPATSGSIELRFRTFSSTEEDGFWDAKEPEVSLDGSTWVRVGRTFNSSTWTTEHYQLTAWAGQTIRLRFRFWAGDDAANEGIGWFIDDVQIVDVPAPAIPQCLGDGTYRVCPCNNQGGAGRGCASSFNPLGARIAATGSALVSADSLVFTADGVSDAAATIFQGADYQHYPGQTFGGDGLTCMSSPLRRIATVPATGGMVTYPTPGAPSISVRGGLLPEGGTRYYAVRYRNALSFCTPNTFNVTNQVAVTWRP